MIRKSQPAAAYVRRSRSKQEMSIESQKDVIAKWAAHNGFAIVSWYEDTKSGDKERPGFSRLMRDCTSGEWSAIICWDQDRFSRKDMDHATIDYVHLKDNGIALWTVTEGQILDPDNDDLGDNLKRNIVQQGKNDYIKSIAKSASRGIINAAKKGRMGGRTPYAMARTDDGRLTRGDAAEVATVRLIFKLFLSGWARLRICRKLMTDKVPPPCTKSGSSSDVWMISAVTRILKAEYYAGFRRWGRCQSGRHTQCHGMQAVKAPRTRPRARTFIANATIIEDAVLGKPIVSREDWERAQLLLDEQIASHRKDDKRGALLSGLLKCRECGGALGIQRMKQERVSGNVVVYEYYICNGHRTTRQVPDHPYRMTPARPLEELALREIRERFLAPGTLDALVSSELARQAEQGGGCSDDPLAALASLDGKIAIVTRNLAYAETSSALTACSAELERLNTEKAAIERRVSVASMAGKKTDRATLRKTLAAKLEYLASAIDGPAEEQHAAMHTVWKTIVVTWGDQPAVEFIDRTETP